MKKIEALREQTVMIVGLGKSGQSAARFLNKHGVTFSAVDNRGGLAGLDKFRNDFPDVRIYNDFEEKLFAGFDVLILSPGISAHEPAVLAAVKKGAWLIGDIEIFSWVVKKPVIAITGSNGKSTVVAMVGEICKGAGRNTKICGNFGDPALDHVDDATIDLFVLELSSFQLEATHSLSTMVSCVLNISEDHMDRYNALQEYIVAKQKIYNRSDCLLVNRSDKNTWPSSSRQTSTKIVYFAEDEPLQKDVFGIAVGEGIMHLMLGDQVLMAASMLKVVGRHNAINALVAIAIGREIGIALATMVEALEKFDGLPHRVEFVCEKNGIRWFNDSKGTNVGATVKAIKGLGTPIVLIAGGEGKGADFSPLVEVAGEHIKAAVLIGRDASIIADCLSGIGVPVMFASTMAEAVKAAGSLAITGDIVLLSPACASFDMFKNFEERGEIFTREVMREVA